VTSRRKERRSNMVDAAPRSDKFVFDEIHGAGIHLEGSNVPIAELVQAGVAYTGNELGTRISIAETDP